MKRSTIGVAAASAGLLAAITTGALVAQAHDNTFTADCTGYALHLSNYPAHSSVTGTVDGAAITITFAAKYDLVKTWTGNTHSIHLSVTSGDGDHRYDKKFDQEITGCLPSETPTSTPSGTPSSTPTSTPQPSGSSSPSTPAPSTEPTLPPTPIKTSPSPEPTIDAPTPSIAPKTEAPIPVAVQAPATFTG